MLSVTDKMGPYVPPQVESNAAFDEAKKQRSGIREDFNIEKVLGESNNAIAAQLQEDKKTMGEGDELRIGESKNDKEFREMLERVSGRKQEKLKNKLDKDDYLNLMVTQLKYQDPTKPMENHEMATQLAQFNTVEQLINVNKSLNSMSNQNAQANVDRLSAYLGKLIEVNGSKLKVNSDQTVTQGSLELPASAGSVSVLIKDQIGTVVRTIGLGNKDMGRHDISWDGKTDGGVAAKPGEYSFEVQASTLDGKEIKAKTSFLTKVDSITDLSSGGKLGTATGAVEAKDVLSIRPLNSETVPAKIEKASALQDTSPSTIVPNQANKSKKVEEKLPLKTKDELPTQKGPDVTSEQHAVKKEHKQNQAKHSQKQTSEKTV